MMAHLSLGSTLVVRLPITARAPLPPFVEPQLATPAEHAPDGDEWMHELKLDGYRIVARLEGGRATLLSRRANDWTAKFPTVRAAVEALPVRAAILDGEVAVPLADGRTSFQALQNVLGSAGGGAVYYLFDLLHLDGDDLRSRPLEARKQALKELLGRAPSGGLRYCDHVIGRGPAFYAQVCGRGLEGIVCKRRDAPYRSGRGTAWLKVKCTSRQELVIGGYTLPEGSREGLGSLIVGTHDAAGWLQFAGKVGTGFSQKTLRELHRRLVALETKECPFAVPPPREALGRPARWVRP
jgi:bifunctional non-homologous end joining protein LigD